MTFKILDLIEKARSNLSSSNDDILKTHASPVLDDTSKHIKNNSSITVWPKKLFENEAAITITQQPIQVKEQDSDEIDHSDLATTSSSESRTSISSNSIVRDSPTYFVATNGNPRNGQRYLKNTTDASVVYKKNEFARANAKSICPRNLKIRK